MFNEDIKFKLPKHGQCSFFGIIGSILGAGAAKKGLSNAEGTYDEYGNLIKKEQKKGFKSAKDQYRKSIGQFEPYSSLGLNLLDRYEQTLTPGSKWYQWRQKEGEKGVNRYLASRGLYGSGEAATEAFQRMGTQLSAEEEALVNSRLVGGVELGYNATGKIAGLRAGLASLYGNKASNMSNLYTWLAEKKATIAQEKGNINAGLYSGIGNTIDQGIITGLTLGMGGGGSAMAGSGAASSVASSVPRSLTTNSLYNYGWGGR